MRVALFLSCASLVSALSPLHTAANELEVENEASGLEMERASDEVDFATDEVDFGAIPTGGSGDCNQLCLGPDGKSGELAKAQLDLNEATLELATLQKWFEDTKGQNRNGQPQFKKWNNKNEITNRISALNTIKGQKLRECSACLNRVKRGEPASLERKRATDPCHSLCLQGALGQAQIALSSKQVELEQMVQEQATYMKKTYHQTRDMSKIGFWEKQLPKLKDQVSQLRTEKGDALVTCSHCLNSAGRSDVDVDGGVDDAVRDETMA